MKKECINMVGQTIGLFTIVGNSGVSKHYKRLWVAKCNKCGYEKLLTGPYLRKKFIGEVCQGCNEILKTTPRKEKHCWRCNKILPSDNFYHSKECMDGFTSQCKACLKESKKVIYEMLSSARKRSKDKKWHCDLTHDFIKELNEKQGGLCPYTGLKLDWEKVISENKTASNNHTFIPYCRASLDRIDSSKGYTKDNVQLVAYIVNIVKSDLSENDLFKMCKLITEIAIKNNKLNNA
jgi:hypothetical protein